MANPYQIVDESPAVEDETFALSSTFREIDFLCGPLDDPFDAPESEEDVEMPQVSPFAICLSYYADTYFIDI